MKNQKTLLVIVTIVTLLCLIAGIIALVLSILDKGSWCLPVSMFMITFGNFLAIYSNRRLKKK